jgi:DNA polymerase elongation subunit (family B)
LNNKLAPQHLGKPFLVIYKSIVDRRLKAKAEGNLVVNESLKITINGSFGKLGSKWSFLYAPDLMMQVTITGQLTLLMLIERLELAGVSVVSGNTDGIVTKMLPEQEQLVKDIVADWEFDTDYEMEETCYQGLYSRGVNDYIAVADGYVKTKGAYADPRDKKNVLKINPGNEISTDAVKEFLQNGTPLEHTIKTCKDVSKFVTIRTVNGGALKNGELIGKAIRWYYGKYELDAMYYKTSGNKVPRSDGAKPMMELTDTIPEDMDFDWYIEESNKILKNIGYKK